MTKPKNCSTYGSFVQMNTEDVSDFDLDDGLRKMMSGPWRVWEIALVRMNNWGHAPFRPGELARLACGKDSPANRAMVRRWLVTLARMGRILSPEVKGGSTQLCVVVNHNRWKRDAGRASDFLCAEPMHLGHQKQTWPRSNVISADDESPETHSDCPHKSKTCIGDGIFECSACGDIIEVRAA